MIVYTANFYSQLCFSQKKIFLISMLFLEIYYFLVFLTVVYTLQDSDGDKSDDLVVDVSNEVNNSISHFWFENCYSFVCDVSLSHCRIQPLQGSARLTLLLRMDLIRPER